MNAPRVEEQKKEPKLIADVRELLFDAPLYAIYKLPGRRLSKDSSIKGYCPHCKDDSIFNVVWKPPLHDWPAQFPINTGADVTLRCMPHEHHHIRFQLMLSGDTVTKWGQHPSFETVSQGETKRFRKVLSENDRAEVNKAIRLAAHSYGIGSFVYIRRIFERVIRRRFDNVKASMDWKDADFPQRVEEQIELLKAHLPPFVVKSKRLYNILSRGIHELDEQECLDFFEVALTSITYILDDETRRKEEEQELAAAERAIASFGSRS